MKFRAKTFVLLGVLVAVVLMAYGWHSFRVYRQQQAEENQKWMDNINSERAKQGH